MSWNKNTTKLLRNWHRDIGYFVVAISLVYGISGILLTHKDAFPVISTTETNDFFLPHLDIAGFSGQWSQHYADMALTKCLKSHDDIKFYFDGGSGRYNTKTGEVSFENYKKHKGIALFVSLHSNQIKGWKHLADLFSIALIFLAVSGLAMVKGKNGFKKRGLWIMLGGVALVVVLILFR